MSIQLNLGDHKSPIPQLIPFPLEHREVARWARSRAKQIATAVPGADVYFRSLPNGRSLRSLLADRSIWINFTHELPLPGVGITMGKEIGLSHWAFMQGRLIVLATLIHELAHVGGAPGTPSQAAEEAALHCGLGHWAEKHTGIDNPHTPYIPGHSG
jgi:hypothetical protein